MNALEMAQSIGKTGFLQIDKMQFHVKILNVRESFGRLDFHVTPVDGNGSQWVDSHRVTSVRDAIGGK
jgi:hypothetical protein